MAVIWKQDLSESPSRKSGEREHGTWRDSVLHLYLPEGLILKLMSEVCEASLWLDMGLNRFRYLVLDKLQKWSEGQLCTRACGLRCADNCDMVTTGTRILFSVSWFRAEWARDSMELGDETALARSPHFRAGVLCQIPCNGSFGIIHSCPESSIIISRVGRLAFISFPHLSNLHHQFTLLFYFILKNSIDCENVMRILSM